MAKRTKNKNENRAKSKRGNDKRIPILLGLFFVGLSFIILVSFISFLFSWQSDSMIMDISVGELLTDVDIKYSNWMGKLGVFLSVTLITKWVGVPAFLIIPIIFLFGMRFFGKKIMPFRATAIRLIVVMFWLSIALSYLFVDRYFLLGGAHGHYMSRWIESMLGKAGTGLFILFLAIGIIAFLFEPIFEKIVNYFRNIATNSKKHSDTETEQNELDTRIETIGTGSSEIKINVVGKEDIEEDTQSVTDNEIDTDTDSYDFVVEKPQSDDHE